MKQVTYDLDVKLASGGTAGDGIARKVDGLINQTLVVGGTFGATVQIQGKLGNTWVDVGTPFTTSGFMAIADAGGLPLQFAWIRVKTTAFSTGTPEVTLSALDSRSI